MLRPSPTGRASHTAGDNALAEVGQRLRCVVRESNTIARPGGDEFVIVSDNSTGNNAEQLSTRIAHAIQQPLTGISDHSRVTASIGVACRPGGRRVDGHALHAAGVAMYRSKAARTDTTTIIDT